MVWMLFYFHQTFLFHSNKDQTFKICGAALYAFFFLAISSGSWGLQLQGIFFLILKGSFGYDIVIGGWDENACGWNEYC